MVSFPEEASLGHREPSRGARAPAELRRRAPLPSARPKPAEDDEAAPGLVRRLLESPSYVEADADVAFLQRDENRGVRLQLDYFTAEDLLRAHGVDHTIVVFGSTRITEPVAARRRLEAAPSDPDRRRDAAIAERILGKSRYYEVARRFGAIVGRQGDAFPGGRLIVMTGGGPGIMEAANRGAFDAGAESAGLNISLPHEQFPNPYLTPDLCFRFHYFAMRKLHFLLRARALVAFPGGFGTFDELFETLTLVQTRKIAPVPVVLVGEEYWRGAFDPGFLVREGVIDPEDAELFWYAEEAEEIWAGIVEWYRRAALPARGPRGHAR